MVDWANDRRLLFRGLRFVRAPGPPLRKRWLQLRGSVPYYVLYWLRRPFARGRTIYVFPELPWTSHATIVRLCRVAGIRLLVGRPADRPMMMWEDLTTAVVAAPPHALNARCTDIRKSTVERVFREIFGYGYAVDPLTHRGTLLAKSEVNALHDGAILTGPLAAADPAKVYQRLIDNVADGMVEDLRVPVILGEIPLAYRRRYPVAQRFGVFATEARRHATGELLTAEEERNILAFAAAMHLDFGELDILRDRGDGRIYIVDANKTPSGPARALPLRDTIRSLALFARILEDRWLSRGGRE